MLGFQSLRECFELTNEGHGLGLRTGKEELFYSRRVFAAVLSAKTIQTKHVCFDMIVQEEDHRAAHSCPFGIFGALVSTLATFELHGIVRLQHDSGELYDAASDKTSSSAILP